MLNLGFSAILPLTIYSASRSPKNFSPDLLGGLLRDVQENTRLKVSLSLSLSLSLSSLSLMTALHQLLQRYLFTVEYNGSSFKCALYTLTTLNHPLIHLLILLRDKSHFQWVRAGSQPSLGSRNPGGAQSSVTTVSSHHRHHTISYLPRLFPDSLGSLELCQRSSPSCIQSNRYGSACAGQHLPC